jgi:hypothetical protein
LKNRQHVAKNYETTLNGFLVETTIIILRVLIVPFLMRFQNGVRRVRCYYDIIDGELRQIRAQRDGVRKVAACLRIQG